jgi:hypothetical protein
VAHVRLLRQCACTIGSKTPALSASFSCWNVTRETPAPVAIHREPSGPSATAVTFSSGIQRREW